MVAPGGPYDNAVPYPRRRVTNGDGVTPHRRRLRLRPRDWRMGAKLAAVLVVPSVAFLVVASVQTGSLVGQATALNEFARQVQIGEQVTALVHELQQERDRTAGELAARQSGTGYDPERSVEALQPHYDAVDRRIADFLAAAGPQAGGDAAWQTAYSRVLESLDQLPPLRESISGGAVGADTVFGNYTRAIDTLLELLAEPSPGQDRPELTQAVLRSVQLARVKELGSRVRAQLYAAARAGRYGPEDQVSLTDLRAQQLTALAEFRVTATGNQIARYGQAAADPRFVAAVDLEETTIVGGAASPAVLEPDAWWAASQDRHQLLRQVESGVLGSAVSLADARSDQQLQRTVLVAGAVLGVLFIALFTSVAIGRSIARSLRVLRSQALQVAQLDLPDTLQRLRSVESGVPQIEIPPAAVRTRDEVGEVAEAFVAVHRSAVTVAVEQAVMRRNVNAMFVNLARRSQVLVERQLELLDELERDEGDPDQLDNLFKLDHLAARMRRNDESLLVLAGTEASRRWSRPVALSAVTLAAAAEIEQYPRIRHDVEDKLHIVGHAVGDLVHLLAELLENATAFSSPYTNVHVTGHEYAPQSVLIEITDEGMGMSAEAIEQANATLAEPPDADVAASERMGLFVVSHLAARLGVRVQLRPAERGLVANVWLPGTVLAAPDEDSPYVASVGRSPTDYPTREMRAVGAAVRASAGDPVAGRPPAVLGGRGPAFAPPAARPSIPADEPVPVVPAQPAVVEQPRAVPALRQMTALPAGPAAGDRTVAVRRGGRRPTPARAEAILASAGGAAAGGAAAGGGSVWWERQRGPVAPLPPAPAPPVVPVTAGTSSKGLPVRVPMASLPVPAESPAAPVPAPVDEPDPDAVSSVLSRFYGGVRRAESEDTSEMTLAPAGRRGEEEQE
ncbi:nitrate- and nitrite sensing domain-containing protein [Solwaraspora sp. WMMA2080]|uniref:sensor histidine kinase n=1 Tax=unclassified Solwaraspora TaxID=2627926 RepID=UPI00248B12ED|nr:MULTISPECIES: nitrate- and nitrite sensing domain-containing protein [unclassified Solwaraspora]WBC00016.1 nitrate- and nitrite sensing domain-containing protein [Solwaraspora sp. WMMA2059]WBC21438.1 nitrate- and nitrite sensing domain-containing protein [Solwaraspora sp. WMMA2080]